MEERALRLQGINEPAASYIPTQTGFPARSLSDDWPLASTSSGWERGAVKQRLQQECLSEGRAEEQSVIRAAPSAAQWFLQEDRSNRRRTPLLRVPHVWRRAALCVMTSSRARCVAAGGPPEV